MWISRKRFDEEIAISNGKVRFEESDKYYKRAQEMLEKHLSASCQLREEFREKLAERDEIIKNLNKQILDLEGQNKIMKRYYKIGEDPSQQTCEAVKVDWRVHELEMENIYLKARLNIKE